MKEDKSHEREQSKTFNHERKQIFNHERKQTLIMSESKSSS
jgi:hypothetical protein